MGEGNKELEEEEGEGVGGVFVCNGRVWFERVPND